jgi:hypothetical protein
VLQQRTLITLFRLKQRRPLLQLDENEGVDRRRQMHERLAVRPRQRRGLADQCGSELHRVRGH